MWCGSHLILNLSVAVIILIFVQISMWQLLTLCHCFVAMILALLTNRHHSNRFEAVWTGYACVTSTLYQLYKSHIVCPFCFIVYINYEEREREREWESEWDRSLPFLIMSTSIGGKRVKSPPGVADEVSVRAKVCAAGEEGERTMTTDDDFLVYAYVYQGGALAITVVWLANVLLAAGPVATTILWSRLSSWAVPVAVWKSLSLAVRGEVSRCPTWQTGKFV